MPMAGAVRVAVPAFFMGKRSLHNAKSPRQLPEAFGDGFDLFQSCRPGVSSLRPAL